MKPIQMIVLGLMAGIFLYSCAGHEKSRQSHVPPERKPPAAIYQEKSRPDRALPQIGAHHASVPREKFHPKILGTLKKKAAHQIQVKQLDAAIVTLEQALAIDAQDPLLWHLMAQVKFSQGNWHQVEYLARKSNLFAGTNRSLQKKNWDMIARSMEMQGRHSEADAVRKKRHE